MVNFQRDFVEATRKRLKQYTPVEALVEVSQVLAARTLPGIPEDTVLLVEGIIHETLAGAGVFLSDPGSEAGNG